MNVTVLHALEAIYCRDRSRVGAPFETPITGRNVGLKKRNWARFFASADPVLTQAQVSL